VVRHVEADRFTHLHHFRVRQNYDYRGVPTFANIRQFIKRVSPLAAIFGSAGGRPSSALD
jgi:hypothetical protein